MAIRYDKSPSDPDFQELHWQVPGPSITCSLIADLIFLPPLPRGQTKDWPQMPLTMYQMQKYIGSGRYGASHSLLTTSA